MIKENILFVGCGKMGSAILGGLLKKIESVKQIVVVKSNPNKKIDNQPDELKVIGNINQLSSSFKPDIIIFAVKPQIIADVIGDYKKFTDAIFVSVIAGKKIDFFQEKLGINSKIIRTMPNLPCLINQGITTIFASNNINQTDKNLIEQIFKTVGDVIGLEKEEQINSSTAISGSGPAYVFHFAESLINSAIELGFDKETAKKLALKTMLGSCLMMNDSKKSPTELKEQVTSKKGTTEAALNKLYQDNFADIIKNATQSASKRAKELE